MTLSARFFLFAGITVAPLSTALGQETPETAPPAEEASEDNSPAEADDAPPAEPAAEPAAEPTAESDDTSTGDESSAVEPGPDAETEPEGEEIDPELAEKIESVVRSLADSQTRDFDKQSDSWFRPVIGGRWLPDGAGGATVLGVSGGSWNRLTKEGGKVVLGMSSRARYEGAIGAARGRVLKTDGRFTFHTSILRVEAGGGLEASRSLFENAPELSGVLGAVADTRVKLGIEKFNVLVGARPMWILTGDRPGRTDGPVAGVGDELSHILGANFFSLSATWTRTYTASGPIEQVIAGFEI